MSNFSRLVIVSGGAAGIGEAIVRAYAKNGFHVVFFDIDKSGATLADELNAAGATVEFVHLDISHWDEVARAVNEVARNHGQISVAIANAGIARRVPVGSLTENDWDHVLDINLKGTAQLLRVATNHMVSDGSGALIALSSTSARLGWPEHVHYNASKAGIEGLIRGLAAELGPSGIRVNALLPGVIRTGQSLSEEHSLGEAGLVETSHHIPLRRVGTPEDVADVALFLGSSAARYITGQSIIVDGGMTIAGY